MQADSGRVSCGGDMVRDIMKTRLLLTSERKILSFITQGAPSIPLLHSHPLPTEHKLHSSIKKQKQKKHNLLKSLDGIKHLSGNCLLPELFKIYSAWWALVHANLSTLNNFAFKIMHSLEF